MPEPTAPVAPHPANTIAFQGRPGAYSHLACHQAFPDMVALPCHSFEDAFGAVREGTARLAMIPVDNTVAGRVADVHHLLPRGGLHIVAEHFVRVNHHLLGLPGSSIDRLRSAESHVHAIGQCRQFLRRHQLQALVVADTAGAAQDVATAGDPTRAAIASQLAGELYGLVSLASNIEDAEHNTTRFLVLAREPEDPGPATDPVMTTFTFTVKNRPAALYKALGGFATNGVNMVKLESYIDGTFSQAQFYADIMGHPSHDGVHLALEELGFFSHSVEILGVYPAHPFRQQIG
ncbi:MAG TPA: prephenate dehydratase [Geminicoccus sp.]|jgi:prephenate dehydratase|uniref:prephenate dehydratase n=1 Tax=Geminicoccus sp. TaxID=2024832 RepID=UPI002E3266E2|nr:prephenate dehydratase [Geminicoccus sp.]HEX2529389.1 prephenate dehydratase [Geminicoccus sp.]